VIQVVQEPNTALGRILFKGNGIAVDDLDNIIDGVTQKGTDNSFVSLFKIHSIEMVDNWEQDQRMDIGLGYLRFWHDSYLNFF